MDIVFNYLNGSTFFNGLVMFIMNIGSKYLVYDIPKTTDVLFNKYKFLRYLVVFSIAFISTRNIKISILLTLLFLLIFKYLIHPDSKACILNKNIDKELKKDEENINNEYSNALKVIKKYHGIK